MQVWVSATKDLSSSLDPDLFRAARASSWEIGGWQEAPLMQFVGGLVVVLSQHLPLAIRNLILMPFRPPRGLSYPIEGRGGPIAVISPAENRL